MFEYRQVLTRMRLGDTGRAIARAGLMGRRKAAQLRRTAEAAGWLDVATPLPGDGELAVHLGSVRTQPAVASLAEPHRERITRWLSRNPGHDHPRRPGPQPRLHRLVLLGAPFPRRRRGRSPTSHHRPRVRPRRGGAGRLRQGSRGARPRTGELLSTWIFVMTLAWSRHAYAEVVTDQKVATWLGCHRRAFGWFNGVPARLTIDNPKCAITRACSGIRGAIQWTARPRRRAHRCSDGGRGGNARFPLHTSPRFRDSCTDYRAML